MYPETVCFHLPRWFLRTSKKGRPENVLKVLQVFKVESLGKTRSMLSACFVRFVDLLVRDFPVNRFGSLNRYDGILILTLISVHDDIVRALRTIHGEMSARIFSNVTQTSLLDEGEVGQYVVVVSLWNGLLCLDKWLDVNGAPSAFFY